MNIYIWLDDIRKAPTGYMWTKSVNETKRLIETVEEQGLPIFLDLDHDLGDYVTDGGDGIKLVDWLDETGRHYPTKLHIMNPIGRQNMQAIIDRW